MAHGEKRFSNGRLYEMPLYAALSGTRQGRGERANEAKVYAAELELDDALPLSTFSPPSSSLSPSFSPSLSPSLRRLASDAVRVSADTLSRQTELKRWEQLRNASSNETDRLAKLYLEEQQHTHMLDAQLSKSRRDMGRLQARHLLCMREVQQLRDCVATLHAAHTVDANINALLIGDQSCEIDELKLRLREADRHRQLLKKLLQRAAPKGMSRREFDSPEAAHSGSNAEQRRRSRDQENRRINTASHSEGKIIAGLVRRVSSRDPLKRKELNRLQRSKQNLLDAYQRRNSTTLDNVVRRTSQMSIASATAFSGSPVHSAD
ncbi:hypothetical protein FGB62_137g26 [Gracilaria domingensis]|nr:hypothetical protein FGB62_137g26 [Gracilaria domingensis]